MLYQINTRITLNEIRPGASLDDIPERLWDDLAGHGLRWVWMLGVWQTGNAGREVSRTVAAWQEGFRHALVDLKPDDICGSPFAVTGYSCHSDFGGETALTRLRERLRKRGLKLMLDFVPNHVALDHPWASEHPEWLIVGNEDNLRRDPANWTRQAGKVLAHGRDPYFSGWPDTLQLNYFHAGLKAAMRKELASIAARCDGVRCDMSMLLLPEVFGRTWGERARPVDGSEPDLGEFWPDAIAEAKRVNPNFTLMAEVYWGLDWELQQRGFHFTYDKCLYDRLLAGNAGPVREHLRAGRDFQDRCARFMENHDEQRAASAFPAERYQAAALVTYLMPGLKFFYEGQWEGRKVHASMHLGRRPIEAINEQMMAFYDRLLEVVAQPEVQEGQWRQLECKRAWADNPTAENYLAWLWSHRDQRLLCVVNYGPTRGQCSVVGANLGPGSWRLRDLMGDAEYVRNGDDLAQYGLFVDMPAWSGHVFEVSPA